MREIEFRGKRLDNGEWVYGSLFNTIWRYHEDKSRVCYIFPDDMIDAIDGDNWEDFADVAEDYEVDPDTIGQYTGLKDKNGTKIYEGDVIQLDTFNPPLFVVDFVEGAFCLKQDDYGYYTDIHYVQHAGINQAENIGNIHDNPKLLSKLND